MERLANELSIVLRIQLHNSGSANWIRTSQFVVEFSKGVWFICLTTMHLLENMARTKNSGWQLQGHFDTIFNLCDKEIAMIGFGVGSLGAHFNPVCVALTNGETAEAYDWTYRVVTETQ
jgi:hypothetical protein